MSDTFSHKTVCAINIKQKCGRARYEIDRRTQYGGKKIRFAFWLIIQKYVQ